VGDSDHNVLTVEVNTEVSTSEELELKAQKPITCFEKVPCVHKQMESDTVTME
jgi:hypothetical protein